jgi:hypothetical protein
MRSGSAPLPLLLLLLAALLPPLRSSGGDGGAGATPRSKEAYVTLVYDESFLLGARVLGQSLRESGTERCASRARGAALAGCRHSRAPGPTGHLAASDPSSPPPLNPRAGTCWRCWRGPCPTWRSARSRWTAG